MREKGTKAGDPMVMTYGMSDFLVNSGLLTQISNLSTRDKQCLMGYIAQEVADDVSEEDGVDLDLMDTGRSPYTLDELYARIEKSEEEIERGECFTETEAQEILKKEFLWLQ